MRSRMAFVDRRDKSYVVPGPGSGRVGLLLPWLYAAAVMSPRVGVVSC
jgi:hypothetical protein